MLAMFVVWLCCICCSVCEIACGVGSVPLAVFG